MASAHPGPGREGLEDGARQPSPSLTPFRDNENFIEYRQVVDPKTTYKIGFHNSAPLNVFAMFQRSCKAHPEREAMVWLDDRGEVQEEWTYGEFFERVRRLAHHLHQHYGVQKNDRVILCYLPGLEFFVAFWACLGLGAIAVPVEPLIPFNPSADSRTKLCRIMEDCDPRLVLTTKFYLDLLEAGKAFPSLGKTPDRSQVGQVQDFRSSSEANPFLWGSLDWVDTTHDNLPPLHSDLQTSFDFQWIWEHPPSPDSIAFLQYTSGSTGQPKGVMVQHRALITNVTLIHDMFSSLKDGTYGEYLKLTTVAWLPMFHDMGLIGMHIAPMLGISRAVYMSPVTFIQNPVLWLQVVSRHVNVLTACPPFALELLANKCTEEQLRTIKLGEILMLMVGAEPIRTEALEAFAKRFAPVGFNPNTYMPCYGLAENVLLVSRKQFARSPPTTICVSQASLHSQQHFQGSSSHDINQRVQRRRQSHPELDRELQESDHRSLLGLEQKSDSLQSGTPRNRARLVLLDPNDPTVPPEDKRWLTSSGQKFNSLVIPDAGMAVIVDPATGAECPDGEIGEIWVCGLSKTLGYWNKSDVNEEVFEARLTHIVNSTTRKYARIYSTFLRTGDLGVWLDGELYVTGRLKDMLVIRGTNFYPQDIEDTIREVHPGIRSGSVAAISVFCDSEKGNYEEKLGVIFELRPKSEIQPSHLALHSRSSSHPEDHRQKGFAGDETPVSVPPQLSLAHRMMGKLGFDPIGPNGRPQDFGAMVAQAAMRRGQVPLMMRLAVNTSLALRNVPQPVRSAASGVGGMVSGAVTGTAWAVSEGARFLTSKCRRRRDDEHERPTPKDRIPRHKRSHSADVSSSSGEDARLHFPSSPSTAASGSSQEDIETANTEALGYSPAELDHMIRQLRSAVMKRFGLPIHRLWILKPRTVLKTSSGKIRRRANASAVTRGVFDHALLRYSVIRTAARRASARILPVASASATLSQGRSGLSGHTGPPPQLVSGSASKPGLLSSSSRIPPTNSKPPLHHGSASAGQIQPSHPEHSAARVLRPEPSTIPPNRPQDLQNPVDDGWARRVKELRQRILEQADPSLKVRIARDAVVELLAAELEMPEDSFTDDNEDLSSFGVDSITGASLVGRLSKVFGQEIQPWEFQDDFTVLGIARATVSIAENLQDPSRGGGEKKNRFSSAEFVRPKTTPLSEAARAELREAEEQMKPIAYILGIGTVVPVMGGSQEQAIPRMADIMGLDEKQTRLFERIGRGSLIERRHMVFNTVEEIFFHRRGPGNDEEIEPRNAVFKTEAPKLSMAASIRAVANWGGDKELLTHVVAVTCTGVVIPGLEFLIMRSLGLDPHVERLSIQFMGCFGFLAGLKAAKSIASENKRHRVLLVCTELCSLHMQMNSKTDNLVASAIFSDGSGAVIIGQEPMEFEKPLFELHASSSVVIPNTEGHMGWELSRTGMIVGLDKQIPKEIFSNVGKFVDRLLELRPEEQDSRQPQQHHHHHQQQQRRQGPRLVPQECRWALHPGGRLVIEAIQEAVGIQKEHTLATWEVLRKYGNMSSASLIFVLEELATGSTQPQPQPPSPDSCDCPNCSTSQPQLQQQQQDFRPSNQLPCQKTGSLGAEPGTWIPSLAFGPGLNVEGALLRRC